MTDIARDLAEVLGHIAGATPGLWEVDYVGDVTCNAEDIARIASAGDHAAADAASIAGAIKFLRDHGAAITQMLERYPDMDTAVGQAVGLATYVTGAAKGSMVQCAQHYLSLPYSKDVQRMLAFGKRYCFISENAVQVQWLSDKHGIVTLEGMDCDEHMRIELDLHIEDEIKTRGI